MSKNLVIVESPAKAKTIEGFLGKEYTVKSCFGHVRDLSKNELGVDVVKDFKPRYIISADKKKIVSELKKMASASDIVWLASDEDREGEAISWHLTQALELTEDKIKRIVFHEITKDAILNAIKNPRLINKNLVDAQQARRVLDRLVGFEISPVLWRKVRPALSAGRVQSVAVRLIAEREKEIENFNIISSYKIVGDFSFERDGQQHILHAELNKKFDIKEEAEAFIKKCIEARFSINTVDVKPSKKTPPPPFTTSTLQQEASRKLGFSVSKTMVVAQQLYEAGKITYMRTDSYNLSDLALNTSQKEIVDLYGEKYHQFRKYTTKTKGAQEAHEAIRPTYMSHHNIEGDASQKKLYDMIWKRTIASQMSDALIEKTVVNISVSTATEEFIAKGEVIKFDGFLKVYNESTDEDAEENGKFTLPPVFIGDILDRYEIKAIQKYSVLPARYTEASLVKKLEELGIGRPSTYAPTISTIQKRGYVVIGNKQGKERIYNVIILKATTITEEQKKEVYGFEKLKLMPTDIGNLVNTFLLEHFPNILDYHFTAHVEKEFDEIANGQKVWNQMIKEFYGPFKEKVKEIQDKTEKVSGARLLGVDPVSGNNVYVKLGKFGPMIQIGETDDVNKPKFAGLLKGQSMDTITLDEALELFKLPRKLGVFQDNEIVVAVGKFGPYLKFNNAFYALAKTDNPLSISLERAVEVIHEKQEKESKKLIKEFPENKDVKVLNGRWGAYISIGKDNFKIPKGKKPETLTLSDCLNIAEQSDKTEKKGFKKKSRK